MKSVLIFGATGSIGNYIYTELLKSDNYKVVGTSRKDSEDMIQVTYDDISQINKLDMKFDSVIWALGDNCNDNISTIDINRYDELMNANVGYILKTLQCLINTGKLVNGAKMVIISSIWEQFTRENKLSYSISKAALSGLVKNVAIDLAKDNILINNVLPGVIDNDMSRKTLEQSQFEYIEKYTGFGRVIELQDVYSIVKYLVTENTGITGQSIKVDLGFTNLRKYN